MNEKEKQQAQQTEKFVRLFSLHRGEESKQKVLADVRKGITFTGSNAWILAGAIIIASVGLNVNSTAVIIGAMLISPLMGPIVGAGFALGTYDFDLFKKSLVNLGIATLISLFFSMMYFLISPIKIDQPEIIARTYPSLYDVIIAFFGGLVGAIAITHINKGNAIPGVAIATALMPPICVAGFGIATGQWMYFLGAFFLYTINCVFICVSTYVIVKLLDYPKKEQLDPKRALQIQRLITGITLLIMIPSTYFAYDLYQKEQFHIKVENYLEDAFGDTFLINKSSNYNQKVIEVIPFKTQYSSEEVAEKEEQLKYFDLEDTKLIIRSDTTDLKKDILAELGDDKKALSEKDIMIQDLKNQIAVNTYDNNEIFKEVKVLFPKVENIAVSNHKFYEADSVYMVPVIVYLAEKKLEKKEEIQMDNWLKEKLDHDTLLIYYQYYKPDKKVQKSSN